jgi:hypothetical protein
MFGLGLIIAAIAVGHMFSALHGWLVLGVGMMCYAVIRAVFLHITTLIQKGSIYEKS